MSLCETIKRNHRIISLRGGYGFLLQGNHFRARKNTDPWQEWYLLASDYYRQYGNLLVPRDYIAANGKKLGRWIERQRAAYNGKLACGITKDRVIALNLIGMKWKLETRTTWPDWYGCAEKYSAEHGNLCVPKPCIYQGKALGEWISMQRKRYQTGQLSQFQIDALEKIGMQWRILEPRQSWEQTFQEASTYFAEHGDLKVPEAYRTPRGTSLCQWLRTQRDVYHATRRGTLTDEQIRRLTEIGMVWSVYDEVWEKMYALAMQYQKQHGNLLVKQTYTAESGEHLGQWISLQRQNYRKRPLTMVQAEHIERLNQIGMVWYAGRQHKLKSRSLSLMP